MRQTQAKAVAGMTCEVNCYFITTECLPFGSSVENCSLTVQSFEQTTRKTNLSVRLEISRMVFYCWHIVDVKVLISFLSNQFFNVLHENNIKINSFRCNWTILVSASTSSEVTGFIWLYPRQFVQEQSIQIIFSFLQQSYMHCNIFSKD